MVYKYRNPYNTYYNPKPSPGISTGHPAETAVPDDYPQKAKDQSSQEHLEALQKYHADKRAEHGAVWRGPDQLHKDIAMHTALAQIERAFPKKR